MKKKYAAVNRSASSLLIVLLMLSCGHLHAQKRIPYDHILLYSKDERVLNAAIDLQRYISQVHGTVPRLEKLTRIRQEGRPAIIIADVQQLKTIFPGEVPINDLGREGYVIRQITRQEKTDVLLYATTPEGLINSVYGFLKETGFEFNLGSETIPGSLPDQLSSNTIIKKPVFNVRGVLPWYNFFNSPTSWNEADHRAFVDQLIRSGANFITFHSYEHEPFAAVKENGKMIFGKGLHHTGISTWGTHPIPTDDFMFGTNKLFDSKYFGAQTTIQGYDESTQIEKEKEVLYNALLYAKNRGLKTSMGFAPLGDPTKKEDRDRFIKEFSYNLDYYNFLDYIYIWQTETKGAQGHPLKYDRHILPDTRDPKSKIVNYGKYRSADFKRIVEKEQGIQPFFKNDEEGKIARACEGARLELFAKIALRILSRYKNAPKLVIAGWGGENYLLSEEYYEGLDKILPADVAFSSLESLSPKKTIDKAYFELPSQRQRWPIPWLENDGDQWHPQTYLNTYEPMARDLLKSGSQGFLTIHWRTREVEDNFGYLVDFAWNPTLTRDLFFENKAKKYPGIAQALKQIYLELDNLGYRWVGGSGQNECAFFTWGSGSPGNLEKLQNVKSRLEALLPQAQQGKDNLTWLRDRMEWVINYQYAEVQAEIARDLLAKAKDAEEKEKKSLAKKANAILAGDALAKAMQSYALRITTRGEYGVLATINAKAAHNWRQMYQESCDLLGIRAEMPAVPWHPSTKIIIPGMYTSSEQGKDFELKAIVLGGRQAICSYRSLGSKDWKHIKMKRSDNWVQSAIIPTKDVGRPGFEYIIKVEGDKNYVFGPRFISLFPHEPYKKSLEIKAQPGDTLLKDIKISGWKDMQLIEWNDVPNADYYQVFVDAELQVETPVNYYPYEGKLAPGQKIKITAFRNNTPIAEINRSFN